MKKIAVMVASAIAFVTMASTTALADYTESPPPENVVEGAGGVAGNGGADATAFTGGDTSTAVIVAVALVAAGLLALWLARRRAKQAS
ncbi:MAG TPA: LPXTG cell wall anchor domain-containing protein [Actinomycetota bacterium]|nr:LPXTG cell wall anchor domain-containing protein [Actinomycetota bacterium]